MIYYGFDEVLQGWDRYFDLCNLFELRNAEDPSERPSIKTMNRWRVDSPRGFAWVMHADAGCVDALVDAYKTGAALGDEVDAAIAKTEERAGAIAAKAVVLETPPELPPSDISRAALIEFGQRFAAASKRRLIWESSGLWTNENAGKVASEAQCIHAVDPFMVARDEGDLGRGGDAAFRITERAAARRQFDSWEMEQLLEWAGRFDRTFVLLGGRYKIEHARELNVLTSRD